MNGQMMAGSGVLVIGFLIACIYKTNDMENMQAIELGMLTAFILFIASFITLLGVFFYKWFKDYSDHH